MFLIFSQCAFLAISPVSSSCLLYTPVLLFPSLYIFFILFSSNPFYSLLFLSFSLIFFPINCNPLFKIFPFFIPLIPSYFLIFTPVPSYVLPFPLIMFSYISFLVTNIFVSIPSYSILSPRIHSHELLFHAIFSLSLIFPHIPLYFFPIHYISSYSFS